MRILSLVFCAAVTAAGTTPLIAQDTLGREPVSLLQVLDSVAARYPSLEAARARIRAARGSRSTAGTLGNPILMYQVDNQPLPGRAAPPMDREMMLTAMLPLEPLYQRWSRVSGANAEVRAAEADAQADRTGCDARVLPNGACAGCPGSGARSHCLARFSSRVQPQSREGGRRGRSRPDPF